MTSSQPEEAVLKKRLAPSPTLDLAGANSPRRRRSSGLLSPQTPLSSTRTPTSRRKWQSTTTKIQAPSSDKAIMQRALAELTLEEEDRKAMNKKAMELNSGIAVVFGASTSGADKGIQERMAERAQKKAEMDELFSMTYDEFREPVDIEQGALETLVAISSGSEEEELVDSSEEDEDGEVVEEITTSVEDPCGGITPALPPTETDAKETKYPKIERADQEINVLDDSVKGPKDN